MKNIGIYAASSSCFILLFGFGITTNSAAVSLVVQLPSERIRSGDTISFTYYLQNLGYEPIYVYPPTPIGLYFYDRTSGVSIEVVDAKTNQPVEIRRIIRHTASGAQLFSPLERIRGSYVLLKHGHLVGLTHEFDTAEARLPPGEYLVTISYSDLEPEQWSEEELKDVSFKVFSGEVRSAPIRLILEPRREREGGRAKSAG